MEDDYFFTEKHSIRESARSLKKYGSTCNHVRNELSLIRHELEKTDTLQGIALKYGCTVSWIWCWYFSDWKLLILLFLVLRANTSWRHYNFWCFLWPPFPIADWTNTSSKSSVRSRQLIFETVPDDTGWQRFTVLSERWSTTIPAHWLIK